jgi:hypothetical protein
VNERGELCSLAPPPEAFAFDPSHGTLLGNQMQLVVRYEQLDPVKRLA